MEPKTGKMEQLNSLVRALCVLQLVAVFCFGFVWSVVYDKIIIDGAAFIGVLSVAMTWWFASRQQQSRATDGNNGAAPTVAATVAVETKP